MVKALVTGGAGFIGSNLTDYLLTEGFEVTVFDNLSRKNVKANLSYLSSKWKTPKFKITIGDIRNYQEVKREVKKSDLIYHLAAQVAVTTSFLSPREDFEVNALGSFNILEAARESGHKPSVIYSSTNKCYGHLEGVKIKEGKLRYSFVNYRKGIPESFPLDFYSPYGCSKGAADQYFRDYFRMYGIPTVVFRQSCIYGPRQMGIEDQGWVAYFAIASQLGRPITIYGDGKQVRDLLCVTDLINAYQKALSGIKNSAGQVYNIGGGAENSLSLLEYLSMLEKFSGRKVGTKFKDWRPGDQKVYISDNGKMMKELGWKPLVSYKKGLKELFDWVSENKGIFL